MKLRKRLFLICISIKFLDSVCRNRKSAKNLEFRTFGGFAYRGSKVTTLVVSIPSRKLIVHTIIFSTRFLLHKSFRSIRTRIFVEMWRFCFLGIFFFRPWIFSFLERQFAVLLWVLMHFFVVTGKTPLSIFFVLAITFSYRQFLS